MRLMAITPFWRSDSAGAVGACCGQCKVNVMVLRWLGALLVVLAMLAGASHEPRAAPATNPSAFIDNLANQALKILNEALPEAERERRFKPILQDNFDIPRISRFVLGRHWSAASDQEKQEFQTVFADHLLRTYANLFGKYNGQTVKVDRVEPAGENTSVVYSQIIDPAGAPPVKVVWRVIGTANDYRISDVSVDGVSQLLTYRDEFADVMQRQGGGVSTLIRLLRERLSSAGGGT